ncbi:MAG: adenylate/guanylate cyclase domain-containing protein [Alphaproteobacteria bacterium]
MSEARVQRRLGAIVGADVVGCSGMMGRDEAGTLARQRALRAEPIDPKVVDLGGRPVETSGDGLLIEFPSAVDAVAYARDVQRGPEQRYRDVAVDPAIRLRVGINVGDVIVDDDGHIDGDGMNVAARLSRPHSP